MKKGIIFAVAILFMLAGMVSMVSAAAAPNVGNTTQKGSVLIFPKVRIAESPTPRDTYITIANDYYSGVNVKCYWVRGSDQHTQDFSFRLTANQPVYFLASTGEPKDVPPFEGPDGMLICFAVDPAGENAINFNHLYGSATVINYSVGEGGTGYAYNSWNFAARANVALKRPVGTPGTIALDGINFDACPQYLLFNFPAVGAVDGLFVNDDLTLLPCKQDLRQDHAITHTKAQFDLWNLNEVHYTGVYQCINCWFESLVSGLQNNATKFNVDDLHSAFGRLRVTGVASSVCSGSVASPLLGLLVEQIDTDTDEAPDIDVLAAVGGNGAGTASGYILWDNSSSIIPEFGR